MELLAARMACPLFFGLMMVVYGSSPMRLTPSLSFKTSLYSPGLTKTVVPRFAFLIALTIFDAPSKAEKDRFRYVMPLARLSYLTLTIYYLQNIPFFLPNTILPNLLIVTIAMILYLVFYMVLAYYWEKRKFLYSMEWLLRKVTA